jgi:hypothetical protein
VITPTASSTTWSRFPPPPLTREAQFDEKTITPPRTGKRGCPKAPCKVAPKGLTYALVEKPREKGRVVSIATRVVFGTRAAVIATLEGTQDVPVQQGLEVSRVGEISDDVREQFLVAGSDVTDQRRPGYLEEETPGDRGRVGRSCLVNSRMVGVPSVRH